MGSGLSTAEFTRRPLVKTKPCTPLLEIAAWKNYTIETEIRIDNGRWTGLIFRAQNEREYYVFYLNVPNDETEFWRHKKGGGSMHVIGYLNNISKLRMSKLRLENSMT